MLENINAYQRVRRKGNLEVKKIRQLKKHISSIDDLLLIFNSIHTFNQVQSKYNPNSQKKIHRKNDKK